MRNKILKSIVLALVCILAVGCGNGNNEGQGEKTSKTIEFETTNLDEAKVDSSIFKEYDLTMINIWGTYCGPCKEEMPMLQEIYEEMKEKNVNLIGIVSDADSKENIKIAKDILKASEAKFENIVPDKKLIDNLFKDIQGVPTTIFVDSKGNVIGSEILGAVSKENYIKEIESRLKTVKESKENKNE